MEACQQVMAAFERLGDAESRRSRVLFASTGESTQSCQVVPKQ